jgi:hypothetical protein
MRRVLRISRNTYYAHKTPEMKKDELNDTVVKIFNENQHAVDLHV